MRSSTHPASGLAQLLINRARQYLMGFSGGERSDQQIKPDGLMQIIRLAGIVILHKCGQIYTNHALAI
jgi:hypothetical protein